MFFNHLQKVPPDPIFGLSDAFKEDSCPEKVDLSVGIYKTPSLKTPVLHCVEIAAKQILKHEKVGNYLPFDGDTQFVEEVKSLVFGDSFTRERVYGAQSLGGTGGLSILGEFISREIGKTIYVPDPTWANHVPIFQKAGLTTLTYPYYSHDKMGVHFEKTYAFLSNLPEKSIILLHACCHNPTGSDLNKEEWKLLSKLFKRKNFLPLFDLAYLGLGLGLDEDTYSIRLFSEVLSELLVVTTFSKNFSLYRERIGAVFAVTNGKRERDLVGGKIKRLIRVTYSNPPSYGAAIVKEILQNNELKEQWIEELGNIRIRLTNLRNQFVDLLKSENGLHNYQFLKEHKGMFSFCNLGKDQVRMLIDRFSIYMPDNGRINISGLNDQNIDYVIKAILHVSKL